MKTYPFNKQTTPHTKRPFVIVNKPRPLGSLTHIVETLTQVSIITIGLVVIVHAGLSWSGFLTPLLAAIVFGLMLSPAVTVLEKRSVPSVIAVTILMVTIFAIIFLAVNLFWEPIRSGVEQLPALTKALDVQIDRFMHVFETVTGVEQTQFEAGASGNTESESNAVQNLEIDQSSVLGNLLVFAPPAFGQLVMFFGTIVFFLATKNRIRAGVLQVCFSRKAKLRAARILRDVELNISRYLLTITVINVGLGLSVGIAMWLLNLEFPVMWGVAAAILNFIPYVGPAIMTTLLIASGLVSELPLPQLLFPAGMFLLLNFIEFEFVTPAVLGRSLTLNPFIVFVSISFWIWLWGPIGAFLAVPVLLMFKVTWEHLMPNQTTGV